MLRRLALSFAALVLANAAFAQEISGTWAASYREKFASDSLSLQFRLKGERHNRFGHDTAISQLRGLAPESVRGAGGPVKFELVREAGTTSFDGQFRNGDGSGFFVFQPNAQYVSAIGELGYVGLTSKDLFTMAIIDVTPAYTRELQSLGFRPALDGLIEARIFNVTRAQVEGLKSVGYKDLPLKQLVELRIFHVTPEYIKEMRADGFDVPLKKYVELRIFRITPAYRRQMAEAGYPNLPAERLVEFSIHGITPAYIAQMAALGFRDLPPERLVEMRLFRVSSAQVEELKALGYTGLNASELVNLRVHDIGREFIERVRRAGYTHPTVSELVNMKLMGIPRSARLY